MGAKIKEVNNKKHRVRKRSQYNGIREQMEFYFGDANLSKDRFLKQLIDKDPFVALDIFLTFNKMKSLVNSVEEIAKSLSNSDMLELDEAQQKVRRKTPMPVERNVDEKTLYVESIPPKADHDWVRGVFERFGVVTYVSLPKYAKSRRMKEFGFVEFEQEASVAKAITAFAEFNGLLQMQSADPAELTSVKAFIKEQAEDVEEQKNAVKAEVNVKTSRKRSQCDKEEKQEGEQKHTEFGEEPQSKKLKTGVFGTSHNEEGISIGIKASTKKDGSDDDGGDDGDGGDDSETESGTATETAGDTTADEGQPSKDNTITNNTSTTAKTESKEHTKRRHRNRRKSRKTAKDAISWDAAAYQLKVLPKRDWKRLRNQYLNLQREEMSKLKRLAWNARQQQQQQQAILQAKENAETIDATCGAAPSTKKVKPNSERRLPKVNMNFYGAGDEESQPQKLTSKDESKHNNPALQRAPLFSYAPGIIVEVSFQEPCVNVKEFKVDMRQYATVKYVDVKEGAMQAQLRLENSAGAEDFVRQVNCSEYMCKVLSGEAEMEYWKKIELDREVKLNKQVKAPQKRGREKMKKLVATHLRFDDED